MNAWRDKLPKQFKLMRRDTPARRALAFVVENFPEIVAVVGGTLVGFALTSTMPMVL